jgi:hypothetical protein
MPPLPPQAATRKFSISRSVRAAQASDSGPVPAVVLCVDDFEMRAMLQIGTTSGTCDAPTRAGIEGFRELS